MRFKLALDVDRALAEVWSYVTDPGNLPEWQSSAIEARKEADGPLRVGSRVREVRKFLGRRAESELEVTEYEPEWRFSLRVVDGPVKYAVQHTFEAIDGGTRVAVVVEGTPAKAVRLAGPIVARAAEREFRADFERLKRVLERRT